MALFGRGKSKADNTNSAGDAAPVSSSHPDEKRALAPVTAPETTSASAAVPESGVPPETVSPVSSTGWPSDRPIVVGQAGPSFEPKGTREDFQVVPCRPDIVIDGWSTGPFTLRAATTRGYSHRHLGTPRQDDYAVVLQAAPGPLIVAVADGVSGAHLSHVGSTTAVGYASQWLARELSDDIAQTDWRKLLQSAAWALVEQAKITLSLDDFDAERTEQSMATTLVCAVCQPIDDSQMRVWLVGVGDSGAWVLEGNKFARVLGGKSTSESGLTSSAVTALPRIPDTVEAVEVTVRSGQALLVGTDGFGDPLGGGTGEVGKLFSEVLNGDIPPLLEFAHALDFSRETFDDDRTLVAVWPFHPSRPSVKDTGVPATAGVQRLSPEVPVEHQDLGTVETSASDVQAGPDAHDVVEETR
jgi:hypothetical protein